MKKEIVYTLDYTTPEEIQTAKDLKQDLYQEFKTVTMYPNGTSEVRIVATNDY